ncbi:hypothetical protein DevBK_20200 [Devosia sp. BK]|uniref:hypothetical protein n=1 Tax=Devosia sp. BK TaxID=2871706 RepID=UPI00293A975D|nr:hypothetical protein [Devosia sp. BK]MDV3253668.1 hypothetical protein [Devosia sp. BK]
MAINTAALYSNSTVELSLGEVSTPADTNTSKQISASAPALSLYPESNLPDYVDHPDGCVPLKIDSITYENKQIRVSEADIDQLRPILGTSNCSVTITEYRSTSAPDYANKWTSQARENAVLNYLIQSGTKFRDQSVLGFGGTDQFGPDQASNRRVVVEVK